MRPIYTSSVYRRRLGSSDRARADAMGGSSAEASPQFFPHRFSKGQACALGSSEVIVLSAYSQRNFSKISAYPQQIAPKYGLIRPSKSPFIGLTQTFNRSYKALENCPLKDTLKGPLKGPFCTCPSAPYKAFSSSLCLPKPSPAYIPNCRVEPEACETLWAG